MNNWSILRIAVVMMTLFALSLIAPSSTVKSPSYAVCPRDDTVETSTRQSILQGPLSELVNVCMKAQKQGQGHLAPPSLDSDSAEFAIIGTMAPAILVNVIIPSVVVLSTITVTLVLTLLTTQRTRRSNCR